MASKHIAPAKRDNSAPPWLVASILILAAIGAAVFFPVVFGLSVGIIGTILGVFFTVIASIFAVVFTLFGLSMAALPLLLGGAMLVGFGILIGRKSRRRG